jgi:two-component sensor histidine kinase
MPEENPVVGTEHRRRQASLSLYLAALVALVALPLLFYAAFLLANIQFEEQARQARIAQNEADGLAARVGQQLRDMTIALNVLASSPELESGQLDAYYNRSKAALRDSRYFLLAVRADGQQLFNTRVPYGKPLGVTSDLDSLKAALASGEIVVSNAFLGRTSQRHVFNVIKPLPHGGVSGVAALILTQNIDEMQELVAADPLFAGWSTVIVDASRRVVLAQGELAPGAPFSENEVAAGQDGDSDDTLLYSAVVPNSGWTAYVFGPAAASQNFGIWWQLFVGGLIVFAMALVAGLAIGRQLNRSAAALADMAVRIGNGEVVPPIVTPVSEINHVALAMSKASTERSEAETEMRLISRELVHRTKNLLAVVQALISQTVRQGGTLEQFQERVNGRIQGLAQSIDLMVSRDGRGVSLRALIERQLAAFTAGKAELEISGAEILLKPDVVQTLGMTFHELSTNAVKYGALSVPGGRLQVSWQKEAPAGHEPVLMLRWREIGGPPASPPAHKGFGTTVIERHIVQALNAQVELDYSSEGFSWVMRAPIDLIQARTPHYRPDPQTR